MGDVMFYLVPFLAGFSIALVARRRTADMAAMGLATIASLGFLIAGGWEGLVCAVMAFPLLAGALILGAEVGRLFVIHVVGKLRRPGATTGLVLAVMPAVILIGHQAELKSLAVPRREAISNTVMLQAPPDAVWANIQSIDQIDVSKPWLMYMGLPTPIRCTLEKAGVGARRTCYFNNGFIQETITAWSPPYLMGLTIDRTNMPGRHWLGFESAAYELRQEGNTTRLTRTTIITSRLLPAWYWRYFERLGVEAEHDYILRDLKQRMSRRSDATSKAGSVQ